MAKETGTLTTYDSVGQAEDVSDIIYELDKDETPFTKAIGRESVKAVKPEWQIDDIGKGNTNNAQIEGRAFTFAQASQPTMVSNITQIMEETIRVSGTQEAIAMHGRASDFNRETVRAGKRLNMDREAILLNNQASNPANDASARTMAGLPAWLTSSTNAGTSGADGGYNTTTKVVDARTDGTLRDFTEEQLKDVVLKAHQAGGKPTHAFMGLSNKVIFSGFQGIAALTANINDNAKRPAHIVASANVYQSDFGDIIAKPSRHMRQRDVLIIDTSRLALGVLRGPERITPAKTGDNKNRVLQCEETLICKLEAAHAGIFDLNHVAIP